MVFIIMMNDGYHHPLDPPSVRAATPYIVPFKGLLWSNEFQLGLPEELTSQ
jgi:hypothetical protein